MATEKVRKKKVTCHYLCIKSIPKPVEDIKDGTKEKKAKTDESKIKIMDGSEIQELLGRVFSTEVTKRFRGQDERLLANKNDKIKASMLAFPNSDDSKYKDFDCLLFMKKRTADLPSQAKETNDSIEIIPIEISDDSYVMEVTFVMVHKTTGIIMHATNKFVGTDGALIYYLSQFGGSEHPEYFEPCPIANVDAFERMDKMEMVSCFEMSIAGTFFEKRDANKMSLDNILDNLESIATNDNMKMLHLVVRAENKKSLSIPSIINLLRSVFKSPSRKPSNVCRVFGCSEDGPETIDFIKNDYIHTFDMEYTSRYIPAAEVFERMLTDFKQKLPDMKKSLGLTHEVSD